MTVVADVLLEEYNAFVAQIQAASDDGDLEKLGQQRQNMADKFPLTPILWRQWIADEDRFASDVDDRRKVLKLYSRAVMDYLEPELWREYIKYAIQGCRLSPKLDFEDEEDEGDDEKDHGDQDDDGDDLPAAWSTLDEVRAIYSSALHATALHFTQSHVVWNLVIKFEIHQITSANSTSAPTDKVSKVRKMFLERLATPHKDLSTTFDAYSSFETQFDNAQYIEHLKAAKVILNKTTASMDKRHLNSLEAAVSTNDLSTWLWYIDNERMSKIHDKLFVRTLYERAIAAHNVDEYLWDSYVSYMMLNFRVNTVIFPTLERAVRNCPWSASIWSHYITASGALQTSDELQDISGRAFTALAQSENLEDHIKLLMSVSRQSTHGATSSQLVTQVFQDAIDMLKSKFEEGDPYFRLEKACAAALVRLATAANANDDRSTARTYFEQLIKTHPTSSDLWLEYIAFEKFHRNPGKARSLYRRAFFTRHLDWPQAINDSWMRFEEQDASSTLDFYYEAYGRVKSSDHKLLGKLAANSQYDEQQQKQQDTHVSANESSTSKTSSKHMITAEKRNGAKSSSSSNISTAVLTTVVAGSDNHAESKKRKIPFADNVSTVAAAAATTISSSSVISPDGTRKRAKVESEIQENVDDDLLDEAEDDQGDAMTGVEHPPAGFDTFYKLDSANAGNMIRVTNIEILTDEAKLKDVFHECGTVVEVIRRKLEDGKSFEAFVEFEKVDQLKKAMKMDGKRVGALDMKLERCRPLQGVWSFESKEEKNKIFVSNLWTEIDQSVLRKAFSKFGKIKDLRLVRKSEKKVFAYIEYEEESFAEKSLELNGKELLAGKPQIKVAISDPRKKQTIVANLKELLLSNLPYSMTEVQVRELFSKFGDIASYRPVMVRGRFSGTAFIQFETEDAATAGLSLTGTDVQGRLIVVGRSDPNIRKGKRINETVPASLPLSARAPPTMFKPRSAMKAAGKSHQRSAIAIPISTSQTSSEVAKQASSSTTSNSTGGGGKSQDDFRKMMGL